MTAPDSTEKPPRTALAVLRALLPLAERAEVIADVEAEHARRSALEGRRSADRWVWRQVVRSAPALLRRSWWRGTQGFEPAANRLSPGGPMMESWIVDARYSVRRLIRRPLYAVLAVMTLALGVGGAASIFTIVKGLLLNPLPYAAEDEITVFWMNGSWSEQEFLSFNGDWAGFRNVAAYRPEDVTLQGTTGTARLVPGISSSAELFDVLGTRPLMGRGFARGDDAEGAEPVALISWGLWQELGGDRAIVGSRLLMDGAPRTVVGVMPRGFWFPDPAVRVWLAESMSPESQSGNYTLVGRMDAGMQVAAMSGPLTRITTQLGERFTYFDPWDLTKNPELTPIRDFVSGPVRPALLATFAAMGAILLMACANVAALMLGQVDGRSTELAVRTALGAGRRRLFQQLVAEALIVGVAAGVTGAALTLVGFPVLLRALPLGALAEGAGVDWTIFITAIAIAVGAAVIVAAAPVFTVWRGELRGALGTTRTTGMGARGGKLESGLVVAEVALAVLMASGAALLIRTVDNLARIDPGIDAAGIAIVDAALPGNVESLERVQMVAEIIPRLEAIPGVEVAAATTKLPLRGNGDNWGIAIASKPDLPQSTTAMRIATPGYFEALGIELKQGRVFDDADRAAESMVVVINEELARQYFPGEDPLGQIILLGDTETRVIGVVGDVAEQALIDAPPPTRYMLMDHLGSRERNTFVLRLERGRDPAGVFAAARAAIQQTAPGSAIEASTAMQQVVEASMGPARQLMVLLTLLAGLALLLGAVGVYGVIAHFVARRRRDIGIRIALGMRPHRVIGDIVARGGTLVGIGIVGGIVASLFLARIVASLLYGVDSADPLALLGSAATLMAAGLAAAAIPAWRASRMDPATVLRDS